MRAYLQSQLDERLRTTVHFHGHVTLDRLFEVLQTARVTVLPSYAEGFALMPLHAMSYGCPTIYSRRGSGPELIDHGRDGLLIDPDEPEEIAEAIIRILSDGQLALQLGKAGQEKVRQYFSTQTILSQNEAFYQSCIESFSNRRSRNFNFFVDAESHR
jgi:glycosyltransferase involved in cell wall biosynthesis